MFDECISVGVISYNSSKTIIETLDSIKEQTYKYIELIISDDGSTDETIDIVETWLNVNKDRFANIIILKSETNRGITANAKKAFEASTCEWYKCIAADDILLSNCLTDYMNFIAVNTSCVALFGKIIPFGGDDSIINKNDDNFDYSFFSKSIPLKLNTLIRDKNCVPAPAAFLNKRKLDLLNVSFDERIPMLDDYPLWINILKNDIDLNFIDTFVVRYRIGGISHKRESFVMFKSSRLFRFYYQYPEWEKSDFNDAVVSIVNEECELFSELLRLESTKAYRIGKMILTPFLLIRKLFNR